MGKKEDVAKKVTKVRKMLKGKRILFSYSYNLAKTVDDSEFVEHYDSVRGRVGEKIEDAYVCVNNYGLVSVAAVDESVEKKVSEALRSAGVPVVNIKPAKTRLP